MSAKNRKINEDVSSSAKSRAECKQISDLAVAAREEKILNKSSRCNTRKSFVWRYFAANEQSVIVR